jgi:RNA polymerase sigma-70 factor (ECF subfamily)
MGITRARSIDELAFPKAARNAFLAAPSAVECEVIALFDQFRNPLLRYILSFGLSVHDGEEVTQEVFMALFRHLQVGKSRKNLRGWIFRVAHNLALRQRHNNQRHHSHLDSRVSFAANPSDPSPDPEEQMLSAQRQGRLLAVLQVLPEQDRCCLGLRAEGLNYREIAGVMAISLGAVSISLTRSLARLMCADER